MTPIEVVTPRQIDRLRHALVDDAVVVIPHFGGYRLAALLSRGEAVRSLHRIAESVGDGTPVVCAVGRQSQAPALSADWDVTAQRLTERMWPGPLTVMVPASEEFVGIAGDKDDVLRIAMLSTRPVRVLGNEIGPLLTAALVGPRGEPVETAADAAARGDSAGVVMVINGGRCGGPGATVVDCTRTPPLVQEVGMLPESYVDAVMMMAAFKRRRWFSLRKSPGIAGS